MILIIGIVGYIYNIFWGYDKEISGISAIFLSGKGLDRAIFWGIPSAYLVCGLLFLEKQHKLTMLINSKIILLIGDASYSIYLLNVPLFYLFEMLYQDRINKIPADLTIIFSLIIFILVGIVFYKYVERPILKWLGVQI